VKIEEQADGSTLFVDYDNRYRLYLPQGWIVIPLSSEDLADILKSISEENPEFEDVAETFKQLDPNVIRIMAVNENPEYILNGYSTNLSVIAIEDKIMSSMPLEFVTGALEESLKQGGAQLISNNNPVQANANGVEIGVIDFQQTTPTATGSTVQARSKIIFFQTIDKVIMVQLAAPQQFADELWSVLDETSESIELIEP
jgi:hypothetical protein